MSSILLSINPEYAEQIFKGLKLYEYRKRLTKKYVDRIIIYATNPIMKVIGEVEVTGIISGSPTTVWDQTKKSAGIGQDKYRKYFKGHKVAYAYRLGKAIEYEYPMSLTDIGIAYPPQSFIYIRE